MRIEKGRRLDAPPAEQLRSRSGTEILCREFPVHEIPECADVVRTLVAIVDVVRVFPHITGEQRLVGRGQRRRGVRGVDDVHAAVRLLHKPRPSGSEIADSALGEGFLERGE